MGRVILFVMGFGFFAELAMFIVVGQKIGVLGVMALVILAAVLGVNVIRQAGMGLADAIQRSQGDRRFDSEQAARRFLLMIAGLLLAMPGFLSDIAGLVLLLPPIRHIIARRLMAGVNVRYEGFTAKPERYGPVIEGEALEIEGELMPPGQGPRG